MSTSSMHVAKTGLNAQQTRMQIIANNLANVNTTGFKRDRANFETLLYQVRRTAGDQVTAEANLTSSFSVGTGARIVNHIGEELGVPQGQLAAERNALNALIKVVAPSLYAALFALGVSRGAIGLPFFVTSALFVLSAAVAASIPDAQWRQSEESPAPAKPKE